MGGFFFVIIIIIIYLFIYLFFYKMCLLISDMRVGILKSADLFVSIFIRVPPCNI